MHTGGEVQHILFHAKLIRKTQTQSTSKRNNDPRDPPSRTGPRPPFFSCRPGHKTIRVGWLHLRLEIFKENLYLRPCISCPRIDERPDSGPKCLQAAWAISARGAYLPVHFSFWKVACSNSMCGPTITSQPAHVEHSQGVRRIILSWVAGLFCCDPDLPSLHVHRLLHLREEGGARLSQVQQSFSLLFNWHIEGALREKGGGVFKCHGIWAYLLRRRAS